MFTFIIHIVVGFVEVEEFHKACLACAKETQNHLSHFLLLADGKRRLLGVKQRKLVQIVILNRLAIRNQVIYKI